MEREKVGSSDQIKEEVISSKPRWKKVGGGSLRIGGRIIKPGQTFEADPEEISPAFRNMVIPVSGNAIFKSVKLVESVKAPVNLVKTEFKLQPHGKSALWYDVVDGQGKIVNEKSLKKEVAQKLLEDLLK